MCCVPVLKPAWASCLQSGGWGLKDHQHGPLLFQYFRQFKEKQWPGFSGTFTPRLDKSYNHCPRARPAYAAWSWPLPCSEGSKTVAVQLSCSHSESKPCQCEIVTEEIWERNYRECCSIKARVPVRLQMAQGLQKLRALPVWELNQLAMLPD